MSRKDRRDGDRRPSERRESQPDDEGQRRSNEPNPQESDSLTALKAILAKVAALLEPLKLTADEAIRLVEQLYGSVLETDVRLAGETDDRRKSSILAHVNNTTVTRGSDSKIVVEYPAPPAPKPEPALIDAPAEVQARPASIEPAAAAPADQAAPATETPVARAVEQTVKETQPRAPRPPRPRPAAAPRAATPAEAPAEVAGVETPAREVAPELPLETGGEAADLV